MGNAEEVIIITVSGENDPKDTNLDLVSSLHDYLNNSLSSQDSAIRSFKDNTDSYDILDLDKQDKEESVINEKLPYKANDLHKPHHCAMCGKGYKSQYALKYHFLVHTDADDLKCTICGKLMSTKGSLKTHMMKHRGEGTRYECGECGKVLQNKYALKYHAAVHKDSELLKCPICQKQLSTKGSLKVHISKHR